MAERVDDLIAEFEAAGAKKPKCSVCMLPVLVRDAIAASVKAGRATVTGMAKVLRNRGIEVGETTLRRHVRACLRG